MGAGGKILTGDVQGRDGAVEDSVGDNITPSEREGGVQGHHASRGVVEGVLSCG